MVAACGRHYRVEGLVLSIAPGRESFTVSHRAIPGYMAAMAMPFRVAHPAELKAVSPGVQVHFDLRRGVARGIRRESAGIPGVALPASPQKLAVGDPVPDFELTDQAGARFRSSDLRGRVAVIDFIYTRCPLPDVCPRLSANFAYLAKQLPEVQLVSITIDPRFDRPEVLAEYASRWGSYGQRWRFLTGGDAEIQRVAGFFGIVYWPEESVMVHTAATAVIDREGRVAAVVVGSAFRADQLRDLVRSVSR